ncbi:MAG: hypothetical protein AYK19_07870 [Theionarchaea archaeon DG-70-1]|nr:MAG: hypothetical protein AYK19_07870 [Theionarchaea archaeon DG-70-1]
MKMGTLEKLFINAEQHKRRTVDRVRNLMNFVELKENQKFLEVGCGAGAVSLYCAQTYHFTVTGVDVDPEQIKLAQSGAGDLDIWFMEADATHLPFEDETFDITLSFGVMHHIANWLDALRETTRVLKPHGYFIYMDIMYPGLLAHIGKSFKHSYGITTLGDFNQFLKESNLSEIYASVNKSLVFNEYEGVFQKK